MLISDTTLFLLLTFPGSYPRSGPPLDSLIFSENLTTAQLLRRLFLTRKLLSLKKLALKNQAMAVNLETLLPRQQATPPTIVPSNSCGSADDILFGDVFSPPSMYGSGGGGDVFLPGDLDFMNFDSAATAKAESLLSPLHRVGVGALQYMDERGTLYQTDNG